jgi:hypothetical protein
VSDVQEEDGDVDWRAVVNLLRQGKTAEIPCAEERDYARRTRQIVKKAGKRDIAVDVHRGDGVLRVEPRSAVSGNVEEGESPAPPR